MRGGATVLSTLACELGEGPTYDPAGDKLYFFDIVGCKLIEKKFPDGPETVHGLPFMASALAMTDGGLQLVATERGLYLRDPVDGALSLHREIGAEAGGMRSNDARVHPSGAFWVSTMGKAAEPRTGAIYWYFRGEVRKLHDGLTIPNAISFSPAGDVAYFADTRRNVLMRVSCDPLDGLPAGEPAAFVDQRGKAGGIDGAVVDAEGVLWAARWGAGRIDAYAPDGRLWRSVPVPARQVSCPAFAGRQADRMVATSAWQGMDAAAREADPDAGRTFLLDLEVRGRFEPRVAL